MKYLDETLGIDGVLKLMDGVEDRDAYTKEAIAYCEPGGEPIVFEGVTKPEINYGFLDSVGSVLQIMCSHENGIKSIYYTLNGQPYQWQVGEGEEAPKELTFQQESVPGHNEMTIKVTSVDDTVAEFNPAWDYAAPNEETPSEEVSAQDTETTEDTNTADTNTTVEGDINSDTDSTNQVTTTGDNTNTTTNN